jgi:hypothetical protein
VGSKFTIGFHQKLIYFSQSNFSQSPQSSWKTKTSFKKKK